MQLIKQICFCNDMHINTKSYLICSYILLDHVNTCLWLIGAHRSYIIAYIEYKNLHFPQ
jgi:hypothetical protein